MLRQFKLIPIFSIVMIILVGCGGDDEAPVLDSLSDEELASMTQIERGEHIYTSVCAECHKDNGSGEGPVLERSSLASYRTADRLYNQVSKFMPDSDPGGLEAQQYYDVVAFLLVDKGFVEEAPDINAGTIDDLEDIALTEE